MKNEDLRELSGSVNINSRLVGFLYDLMRDHLTPGIVEELVREAMIEPNINYTNGWLAKYAEYLANNLMKE